MDIILLFQNANEIYNCKSKPVIEKGFMLDLSMTAKEMREMIVSRKKTDPRKEKRKDIRRRVEMVEAL